MRVFPTEFVFSAFPYSQLLISGVSLSGAPPPSIPSDAASYNAMLRSQPYLGHYQDRCSSVALSRCDDD